MQPNNVSPEYQANLSELHRRGITDSVIDQFGLEYRTDLPFAFSSGWVLPVNHPNGQHFFNKYRKCYLDKVTKQKYTYDKGSRTTLYGVDQLNDDHDYVVITEGEMDALVLWSMNIPAVSSTGGALSFQSEFVELLEGKEVYICYDNDDAGAEGAVKTLELIPNAKVILIPEQVGVKDISDFVSRGGDFRGLMASAKQYLTEEDVEEDRHLRGGQWMSVRFHEAWLKKHKPVLPTNSGNSGGGNYDGDDRLLKAKSYPCEQLLQFNRQHKAKCLWHNDGTPSLHYYKNNNNCYCHSCGKLADSIDIYMELFNVDIKTAIKELNEKL